MCLPEETDFFVASLNTVMSNNWLNEARLQIGRDFEYETANGPGPSTTVTNGPSIGMPNFRPRPKYPDERRYEVIDKRSTAFARQTADFLVRFVELRRTSEWIDRPTRVKYFSAASRGLAILPPLS